MRTQIRTVFSFYIFLTVSLCLSVFLLKNAAAQGDGDVAAKYTFETIEVPGVDFLSVTASSDFEDYAGYTKGPDGTKDVAFTRIDGVFTKLYGLEASML